MLASLAFIFLTGLMASALCQRLKLPRIIGMLMTGMVLGPYGLQLLDASILSISGDLRQIALIIILLKAGFSLHISDLKQVGRPAVLLSFLPALFEITSYVLLAPMLLGISYEDAVIMGAVLAAVSPAVVVPRMVQLIDTGYGTSKHIPQLILAGASCDDIVVIVLFSTFVNMAQGKHAGLLSFVDIPISIVLGIAFGALSGYLLHRIFTYAYKRQHCIRNSTKIIMILSAAFLMMALEALVKGTVPISGLLAVVSMACTLHIKSTAVVSNRLSEKLGKLWIAAEVLLFVLVGAAVDIRYTLDAGFAAAIMILIALCVRSIGVFLCLLCTPLNRKERIFCMIAYLPKATVQAAIGAIPLSLGLPCGQMVLSTAVLGILISAPLGAFGMDRSYQKLLTKDS